MRLILIVLVLAAACNGDSKTAPAAAKSDDTAKPDDTAMENKSIALIDQVADIFTKSGKDCVQLAAGLEQFAVDNKQTFLDIKAWGAHQTAAQQAALAAKTKDKIPALMMKMALATQACGSNPAVSAALKKIRP
ncbi:MAG: hypothetical protein H6Q90_1292 [Deltaproteobacteria bacterium]|nr:hypothetical protein [Deltaproteobacteria bacterium]